MSSTNNKNSPWWASSISATEEPDRRKNHCVPEFYLRRWASGQDKKLWYYSKGYKGKIMGERISPKNTAFEFGINTLKKSLFTSINEQKKQIVEEELSKLDTDAAPVLKKMVDKGPMALTEVERRTWLNFVLILSERAPQRMSQIQEEGDVILKTVTDKIITQWGNEELWKENYAFFKADNFVYNEVRARLFRYTKERSCFEGDTDLEWRIIDTTKTPLEFFTSISPVIADGNSAMPETITMLEMALTPKKLWISAPKGFQFDDDFLKTLVTTFNFRLMMLKPKYVYSLNPIVDETHAKYQQALGQYL